MYKEKLFMINIIKIQLITIEIIIIVALLLGCNNKSNNISFEEKESVKYFVNDDWLKMVECANKWVVKETDTPIPHALLNIAYSQLQDQIKLKKELDLAYGNHHNVITIKDWSSKLLDKYPSNPNVWLLNGIAAEKDNDNKSAIYFYEQSIKVDPHFEQGYLSLGNLYFFVNRLNDALSIYRKLSFINPENSLAYVSSANIYLKKNDIFKAVAYLEHAIHINPHDIIAKYNLARAYIHKREYELAKSLLNNIIELNLNNNIESDAKKLLSQLDTKHLYQNTSTPSTPTTLKVIALQKATGFYRGNIEMKIILKNNIGKNFVFDTLSCNVQDRKGNSMSVTLVETYNNGFSFSFTKSYRPEEEDWTEYGGLVQQSIQPNEAIEVDLLLGLGISLGSHGILSCNIFNNNNLLTNCNANF